VWVFSILNHGRVTHGSGLYKAGVGLQGYNLISDNSVSEVITGGGSGGGGGGASAPATAAAAAE
jgi:hypothetical protein